MSALLNLIGLAARINAPGNFLSAAIPLYVAYRSALVAAPLPTTAATAGALAAFGDALAQTSEMRSQAMLSRLSKSPSIGSAPSENRIPSITLGQTSSGLIHTAPKLGMPDALVSLQFPRVQARSGSKIVSMDCALVEAQRVQPIRKRRSLGFDWRRTLAFTVFGVAYTGCVQHKLFGIYQRHCTGRAIARLLCVAGIPKAVALAAAVQKTLVNQLCAIPLLCALLLARFIAFFCRSFSHSLNLTPRPFVTAC
eukprot:6182643-Pleurochrysis_carterae.AAC.4